MNSENKPIFDNIKWVEMGAGLVFVGSLLSVVLTTAPIPAEWKPWVAVAVAMISQTVNFLKNPKSLNWDYKSEKASKDTK